MSENTVFVIGAGASKEAGLPTGEELKDRITKLINIKFEFGTGQKSGDFGITKALELHLKESGETTIDINPHLKEAWHIARALPTEISIDNFLDKHKDNKKMTLCGKLSIVQAILKAERESLLHFKNERADSNLDFNALQKTWYISFFKLLTENCTVNDLKERFQNVTLIIFNYDRCVEHFIFNTLQNSYGISAVEASDIISNLNIYHPYGSVGLLPWEKVNAGGFDFGFNPSSEQLLRITDRIKTFTEGTDSKSSEIIEIRNKMSEANKLVFLGFAFHKLNMDLITPTNTINHNVHCFATAKGISPYDQEEVEKDIKKLYKGLAKIKMTDSNCNEFFEKFWRSLNF